MKLVYLGGAAFWRYVITSTACCMESLGPCPESGLGALCP